VKSGYDTAWRWNSIFLCEEINKEIYLISRKDLSFLERREKYEN
jgi:hypothetical protein